MLFLGMSIVVLTIVLTAGALSGLAGWGLPCWISDPVGYLSARCAIEQIQAVVGPKNLEVIEISGIRTAGKHEREVEFRSRLREPHDDDAANMVLVDSVVFRSVNHQWRLDSSTLHW
jgi:hypothetical protein